MNNLLKGGGGRHFPPGHFDESEREGARGGGGRAGGGRRARPVSGRNGHWAAGAKGKAVQDVTFLTCFPFAI